MGIDIPLKINPWCAPLPFRRGHNPPHYKMVRRASTKWQGMGLGDPHVNPKVTNARSISTLQSSLMLLAASTVSITSCAGMIMFTATVSNQCSSPLGFESGEVQHALWAGLAGEGQVPGWQHRCGDPARAAA